MITQYDKAGKSFQEKSLRNLRQRSNLGLLTIGTAVIGLCTGGGILTGKLVAEGVNYLMAKRAFENAVVRYSDNIDRDGNGELSGTERDAFRDRVLRSGGMAYKNGILTYSASGKRVPSGNLRQFMENYTEPTFIQAERVK